MYEFNVPVLNSLNQEKPGEIQLQQDAMLLADTLLKYFMQDNNYEKMRAAVRTVTNTKNVQMQDVLQAFVTGYYKGERYLFDAVNAQVAVTGIANKTINTKMLNMCYVGKNTFWHVVYESVRKYNGCQQYRDIPNWINKVYLLRMEIEPRMICVINQRLKSRKRKEIDYVKWSDKLIADLALVRVGYLVPVVD